MKKVLFVCSQNRLRSPTAEKLFNGMADIQVRSAGLDADATTPVTRELIDWATMIVVMEKPHLNKLKKKFRPYLVGKRVVCLNIPDEYNYMDEALIQLFKSRMARYWA